MINANQIQHEAEGKPERTFMEGLKQRVADSPLLALGAAVGAGALAYGLLKPRPKPYRGVTSAVAKAVGRRSSSGRMLKTAVGSLALNFLNRKLRSKIRW
jgi:hypothetical protein